MENRFRVTAKKLDNAVIYIEVFDTFSGRIYGRYCVNNTVGLLEAVKYLVKEIKCR